MEAGHLYGGNPRPRLGFFGKAIDAYGPIDSLVATAEFVPNRDSLRPSEWDAWIFAEGFTGGISLPDHLFALDFGGDISSACAKAFAPRHEIKCTRGIISNELEVPANLPLRIKQGVQSDLLPKALANSSHSAIEFRPRNVYPVPTVAAGVEAEVISPFLLTPDGDVIAGSFKRDSDPAEYWFLPSYADLATWLRIAVLSWRDVAPDRFPPIGDWRAERQWQTPEELRFDMAAKSAQAELDRQTQALERAVGKAEAHLARARTEAGQGVRRLLTTQGKTLVEVVKQVIADIGFEVDDMDEIFPDGDKREDLRVRVADTTDWQCIAEVRGYPWGAQLSDLMRFHRFASRYLADEGKTPSSCWYIVNQFLADDPGGRPRPLASNSAEVEMFATDYEGLVVDSTDLFRLWRAVVANEVGRPQLWSVLKAARGTLSAEAVLAEANSRT
jgi:hypothetical protein